MSAIYINEETAANIINMPKALELTEEAFKAYALGTAFNMPRERMRIAKGALHLLPAAIPYKNVIGYKAYTSFRAGVVFKTYLHDAETGAMLAVIDSAEIGRLRTGAASGVATKYLARADSKIAFIFGAGYQAEAQLEAVSLNLNLEKAYVASRTTDNAEIFADKMTKKLNFPVELASNVQQNFGEADVIITITTSKDPLFDHRWIVKKGVHINAAGSNALIRTEIPEKTIDAAKYLVVDNKDVCEKECGDILSSMEKGRLHWNEIIELGDIIAGFRQARTENESISIFESQGMGLLDIACAEYIYREALNKGLGVKLPF